MTREEAARILDPETTWDAYNEITYYGGFNGEKIWFESANEAGRMGAAALRELDRQEKQEQLVGDEWTSVKYHLPEFTGEYMCRVIMPAEYGKYSVRHLSLKFSQYDRNWICSDMIVTHWMPMLKEPENSMFV